MAVQDSVARTWDVAVAGEIFADHVFSGFDRWPQPGEEHFTDHYLREAGGGATVTACALGRLGRKVAIFAVIGEQDLWLQQRLRDFAVDLEGLRTVPTPTAVSVAISTRDDRSFLTWPGANRGLEAYLREPRTQLRLAQARHVHLALPVGRGLALELFPILRAAGCTLSLDVGHHPEWLGDETNWKTCGEVDLFLPNQMEAQMIAGTDDRERLIPELRLRGIGSVVVKLGPRGAAAWLAAPSFSAAQSYSPAQSYSAAAVAVDVVDTTGAGDAFDAGLIDAMLDHRRPREMLELACLCGSLSTRRAGALAALPDREELNQFHDQFRQP